MDLSGLGILIRTTTPLQGCIMIVLLIISYALYLGIQKIVNLIKNKCKRKKVDMA